MQDDIKGGDDTPTDIAAELPNGATLAEEDSPSSERPPAMTQVETAQFGNDVWMSIVASIQDTQQVSVSAIADAVQTTAQGREGSLKNSLENVAKGLREG